MNKLLPLLITALIAQAPSWAAPAAENLNWLKPGDNVECDINMAAKADGAKWRIGKVHEINIKGNSYTVALPDNSKIKIVNNSKWIKAASDAVTQSFTEPAEIKSEETQRKEKSDPVETREAIKPTDIDSKSGEITVPITPDKSLKNKKGGALSGSASLFRLAFKR